MFDLQDFVGHHWDSYMKGGVHPTKRMGVNLVETIQTSKVTYAKPLKVAWGAWNKNL